MITQKQIAKKAGVSRQLVGHALQGRSNVSAETRMKIYAVAKEMGYHPDANWSARVMLAKRNDAAQISGGRSEIEPEKQVAPPVYYIIRAPSSLSEDDHLRFVDYFNGFVEAFSAWKRGFQLICSPDDKTDLDVVRNIVESGRSSGIVDVGLQSDATDYLIEKEFPTLIVNANLTARGVPSVVADHVSGYGDAWRVAAKAGHRKVVFVGYSERPNESRNFAPRLRECENGAIAAKVDLGIEQVVRVSYGADEQAIWSEFSTACGVAPNDPRWPTLAFTHNDMCAKSLIVALQSHGVHVPQDISVIGFDDISIARHFNPPLATLAKPRFEMAKTGAQLLSDVLAGRRGSRQKLKIFPVHFVARGSFARAADSRRTATRRK